MDGAKKKKCGEFKEDSVAVVGWGQEDVDP